MDFFASGVRRLTCGAHYVHRAPVQTHKIGCANSPTHTHARAPLIPLYILRKQKCHRLIPVRLPRRSQRTAAQVLGRTHAELADAQKERVHVESAACLPACFLGLSSWRRRPDAAELAQPEWKCQGEWSATWHARGRASWGREEGEWGRG